LIIYCGTRGFLDELAIGSIKKFEAQLFKYMDKDHPAILAEIESRRELSPELMQKMDALINAFKSDFIRDNPL